MTRILLAAALAVAIPLGAATAAGPFDGQYTGGSPGTGGRFGCPATIATISIVDGKIAGKYTSATSTFPISGSVAPDGAVTGKWAGNPFTGKFTGGHFAGEYNSKECGTGRPIAFDKGG